MMKQFASQSLAKVIKCCLKKTKEIKVLSIPKNWQPAMKF